MSSVQPNSFSEYMKPWSDKFHSWKDFQGITSRVEKAKILVLTSFASLFFGIFTACVFRKLTENALNPKVVKVNEIAQERLGTSTRGTTEMWVEQYVIDPLIRVIADLPNRTINEFGKDVSLNRTMLKKIFEMEHMDFGPDGGSSFDNKAVENFIGEMKTIGSNSTPKQITDKIKEIEKMFSSSKLESMDSDRTMVEITRDVKEAEDNFKNIYFDLVGGIIEKTPPLPNGKALIEEILGKRLGDINEFQKIKKNKSNDTEKLLITKIQERAKSLKDFIGTNKIPLSEDFHKKLDELIQ